MESEFVSYAIKYALFFRIDILVVLMSMFCNTHDAKRRMLTECRRHPAYYNNTAQLAKISEFERNYRPIDAIRWYTKESFVHMIINEALRTEDPQVLYIYRFYITDLCKRLEEVTLLTRIQQKSSFCVYRGATMDRREIEKLRTDMLVATNGFFSSTLCRRVAMMFIGIDPITSTPEYETQIEEHERVLFEIHVDLNQTDGLIVANISVESNHPEEEEILFGLGTTFVITKIVRDSKHSVWYIGMVVSSEMNKLKEEYTKHVVQSLTHIDATTLFGIYLSEMSGEYSVGINYFQRYLRQMRFNDPTRSNVYYYMARVYRSMGKYQHAIEYFRRAKLLQKPWPSELSYVYADTLSDLAYTYSQVNDTSKAIPLHERALNIFRKVLGENDLDMPLYYTQLAYAYWKAKRHEDAHVLLAKALSILKEDMSSNFAGLSMTKHIMGLVKYALNQQEDAIRFLQEALELRRKLFANDHPFVGYSYYDLAHIYMETDNQQVALKYAQTALTIFQAKLPGKHPDLKRSIELVDQLCSVQKQKNVFSF